ncbi:hypothetical protein [Halalkalibacter hemicellulosilyticus]|uniref:LexA family protein n=1 Tax=Halalkalibacter hemicellulosilyticus TaxID=127886 RepID=UPI0009DD8218|nr:hypothetical protein [Halalkalibacter hemicellulosilyticus]
MNELTNKQRNVIVKINEYVIKNKYAPTTRELADLLNHKSTSTTHGHLVKLRKKGYVDWVESKPRTLRVLRGEEIYEGTFAKGSSVERKGANRLFDR